MYTEQPNLNGSEPFGKFKDAESLVKAYNNLEAEFTKKSQRLKLLEDENSLQQATLNRNQQIEEDVNNFVEKFSECIPFSSAIKETMQKENLTLNEAALNILAKNYISPQNLILNEDFLNNYVYNNAQIKDKIIKEYLTKQAQKTPVKLNFMGNIPLTPPSVPKSIAEAGRLARNIIKQK